MNPTIHPPSPTKVTTTVASQHPPQHPPHRQRRLPQRRSGFTLIEMAIALAIIGIMTSIGIWQSANMLPMWRTRAAALEFSSAIQQCRALAVRAVRECRVLLVDYDPDVNNVESANVGEYWIALGDKSDQSTSWDILPVDSFEDGTDDDTSQGITDISETGNSWKRHVSIDDWGDGFIGGPHSGNANAIVFGPRGFVTNPVTDFTGDGYIEVTFVNKYARGESRVEDYTVKITRSGMVRVDPSATSPYKNLWSGTATSSSAP